MTDSSGNNLRQLFQLQTARLAALKRRQKFAASPQFRPFSFELAIRPLNGISSTPPLFAAPVLLSAVHYGFTFSFSLVFSPALTGILTLLAQRYRENKTSKLQRP
ncbi:hypothetical protein BJY01DRAFT_105912 [Aspergillus pseudoustus]|uniref:Uncharacterized protein n=1 Tax=Aspergillus pseudoustus TaxID=1810923 RepID=A0ABR4IYK9_9EURO